MARIRTLKPDIWTDEKFALLSTGAKLLFIGAISTADDAGRIRAHPALLQATVLPLDRATPQDITKWLRELEAASMIGLYQVRGEALAQLANWAKHQRIDNASRARFLLGPDDPEAVPQTSPRAAAVRRESPRVAANRRGSRLEGEGEREGERDREGRGEEKDQDLSGLAAAQPDRDRGFGVSGTEDPDEVPPPTQPPDRPLTELEWRGGGARRAPPAPRGGGCPAPHPPGPRRYARSR